MIVTQANTRVMTSIVLSVVLEGSAPFCLLSATIAKTKGATTKKNAQIYSTTGLLEMK